MASSKFPLRLLIGGNIGQIYFSIYEVSRWPQSGGGGGGRAVVAVAPAPAAVLVVNASIHNWRVEYIYSR